MPERDLYARIALSDALHDAVGRAWPRLPSPRLHAGVDEPDPPESQARRLAASVEDAVKAATAKVMARTPDRQTEVSVKHTTCTERSTTKWTCRVTSRFDALDDPKEGFTGIATYNMTIKADECSTGTAHTKKPALRDSWAQGRPAPGPLSGGEPYPYRRPRRGRRGEDSLVATTPARGRTYTRRIARK